MSKGERTKPHSWVGGTVHACAHCKWLRRRKMNAAGHAVDSWQYRHTSPEHEGDLCQFQAMRRVPACGSEP